MASESSNRIPTRRRIREKIYIELFSRSYFAKWFHDLIQLFAVYALVCLKILNQTSDSISQKIKFCRYYRPYFKIYSLVPAKRFALFNTCFISSNTRFRKNAVMQQYFDRKYGRIQFVRKVNFAVCPYGNCVHI